MLGLDSASNPGFWTPFDGWRGEGEREVLIFFKEPREIAAANFDRLFLREIVRKRDLWERRVESRWQKWKD